MNDEFVKSLSPDLDAIQKFCVDRNLKIAIVESVTAGFVQFLLSKMKTAGLFYNGGVTTYTCEMKSKLFNIPFQKCDDTNGVNQEITNALAENICQLFNSNLGLALTGYASDIPEKGIFERFAFGSIFLDGKNVFSGKFESTKKSQEDVQMDFASQLIKECGRCLASLEGNF